MKITKIDVITIHILTHRSIGRWVLLLISILSGQPLLKAPLVPRLYIRTIVWSGYLAEFARRRPTFESDLNFFDMVSLTVVIRCFDKETV